MTFLNFVLLDFVREKFRKKCLLLWQPMCTKFTLKRLEQLINVQKRIVRLTSFKSYMDYSESYTLCLDQEILDIFKIGDYRPYSQSSLTLNFFSI